MAGKEALDPKPAFEIPTVSEEQYVKTREALAKRGFTFVVDIESISIGQLRTDEATSQHFGHVHSSENMRVIIPPQMEVAINPKNLRITNSNFKSTDTQIKMIEEAEADFRAKLPQDVRNLVSMRMQNASVVAQLDFAYQQQTGKPLLPNYFARTDDQTSSGFVAIVGRHAPTHSLFVDDWVRGYNGGLLVFAVPVVVLPRK